MKTHTSSFKGQIKLIGKEIDSRITFGSTVLGKNDLNAVTPSYQGAILKSVMKQLDIDSNVAIPIGTILKYEFGLKVNGEYEYINYGNYVVYSIEKQEDTNSYKITCYDKLLYSMLDYVKLPITYPISIRDYINAISTALGLKFANKSETFANYNKQIQADLYYGLGYTFRDILDELAQVTASTICLNNNDELEIRYITETNDTIDEEFLKDVNVNFGEKFGAVNTIVLSRSGDSDSVYYPSVLPSNPYEIKISDNQIMNGNDRADFLPDIYNKLNGLEFYTNDFVSTGIIYYDLCDRYSVKVGDNTYSCVMFNDEVLVTQGLEENVYTELPEQTETDYKHASKDDRMINQVYIIAKKNEAEILALVSTTETIQKEINPTKDESGSEIIIEGASNNPLINLEIEGKSEQATRSGKNLIKDQHTEPITVSGVTFTPNPDGSIKVEGTATANYTYRIIPRETGKYISIDTTKNYTMSVVGELPSRSRMRVEASDSTSIYKDIYSENSNKTYITFEGSYFETGLVDVWFLIYSGYTYDFTLYPQLEEGTTATEYEQYGVSPSPDYPSEIESVGYENLVGLTSSDLIFNRYINSNTGEVVSTSSGNYYASENYIDISSYIGKYVTLSTGLEVAYYTSDKTFISYINRNQSRTQLIPINAHYIRIDCYKDNINEMQITKGTKLHSYIPYGKYGIEVKNTGKNSFSSSLFDKTGTYALYELKDNTPYTLSLKLKEGKSIPSGLYVGFSSSQYDKNNPPKQLNVVNSGVFSSSSLNENGTYYQIIIDNSVYKYVYFYTKNIKIEDYFDVMLTESSSLLDYEPYKSVSSLFTLNQPLRSLPNGVKDKLYVRNNKLYVERYVGSVVLDGSDDENWALNGSNQGYGIVINDVGGNSNSSIISGGYCDCLSETIQNNIYSGTKDNVFATLGGTVHKIYVRYNSSITSIALLKEQLNSQPIIVQYELAEPYTEKIGEIEMPSTYKGINNITTTDSLLPIINLTYVRDTIIADYVENHVAELKLTEKEIKTSVETVSTSVNGLNSTVNRVEEITNDNSQVLNIISTNIDKTSGEVREVTTTTGFTFNKDGMTIDDGSGFKAEHRAEGTYYKDGTSTIGQYTKDGSKQKDLELFGVYSYGKNDINDTPMFIAQLYNDENGEECFGHFVNI